MASKGLKVADNLVLPLDTVTQALAVIAKRRAGKSYFARKLAEQVYAAKQQIVIVDPKGDYWGMLSSRDGKGPGLSIVIIGGERGHVPLEASGGDVVAKLVVEERVSVLLDLSLLRKHEVATFMATFMESLYRLKAAERFRTPMMLLIDEADAIAPQKPQPNEARMLGAAEDIVRRGGQRGIGVVMVSQRAAVLSKNVLTQVQIMIALRTISPQDLAAMNAWIDVHGTPEQRKTLMDSLPSLPVGDAWVWSPGWPTDAGIFKRIHTAPIETFDSGATPKPGEKRAEPKRLADVDLDAIKKLMSDTIERAKADDPAELKKRIQFLQKQLHDPARNETPNAALEAENAKLLARGNKLADEKQQLIELAEGMFESIQNVLGPAKQTLMLLRKGAMPTRAAIANAIPSRAAAPAAKPAATNPPLAKPASGSNGSLTGPEQRIVDAIAWLESIGVDSPEQTAVAFLAGYTAGGGAFNNPRGRLRQNGMVEYIAGDRIKLTDVGRAHANAPKETLTSHALQEQVKTRLPGPERRLLEPLLSAYPEAMANDDLARAAGYEPKGGAFNNPRGRLRTLGLVEYPAPGQVRARDILFPEGP